MDATKWTQGFQEMINVKPMSPNTTNNTSQQQIIDINTRPNANAPNGGSGGNNNNTVETRKARPQEKVNCPRCNSTNTKFCYYNNYSLTQPRYFCKGCRRYWTEGGSLRNVPVGGSSRKDKRSSQSLASSSNHKLPDLNPPLIFSSQVPNKPKELNLLSFPVMQDHRHHALGLLPSNGGSSRGMNTFLPGQMMDSNSVFYSPSPYPTMPDYNQSNNNISFSTHHHQGIGHNNINSNLMGEENEDTGTSRVLLPFTDVKDLSSTTQERNHGNNAYWSGMFSDTGGTSW